MTSPDPVPLNAEVAAAAQAAVDRSHLHILEMVYYVAGVMTILSSSIFIFHFGLFLVMGLNPQFFSMTSHGAHGVDAPPAYLFLGLAALIGTVMAMGWTFGALQIWAGRCLKHRRRRTLIMLVAGVECVFLPWGTALGVGTFICLERASVRALFH